MALTDVEIPEAGQLMRARGQQWVVPALRRSTQPIDELALDALPGRTLMTLTNDVRPTTCWNATPPPAVAKRAPPWSGPTT